MALEPSPTDYADLVKQIGERADKVDQTMLLRSMKQAVYNADNAGHFGLALKRYALYLAYPPLSRISCCIAQSKYLIAKEGRNRDRWTPTGGYHYSFDDMDFYGEAVLND